jgi:hypothetical protein
METQFAPYIFIETSREKPSSIAVAAWTANQMKYITLPSGSEEAVQEIVRSHFKANQGQCHLYGEITGFRFVTSPTESIVLDVNGSIVRRENGQFWPKSISMEVAAT